MNTKIIIFINGYPRSGKDTFANAAVEGFAECGWQARAISSIDPIRDVARKHGVPVDNKGPEERKLLSDLKAAFNAYDRWADRMATRQALDFLERDGSRAIFVHVREPESIDFMHSILPTNVVPLAILIRRQFDSAALSNDSDRFVENFPYDFLFENDGTVQELEAYAEGFAHSLSKTDFTRAA
jgi:hypothetical protein